MNKYRNKKCEYQGKKFDSMRERDRYIYLQSLLRSGQIEDLKTQEPFQLIPKNGKHRAVKYVADFVYTKNGQMVVEDVKGILTPVFKLKARLFYEIYGIDIAIVK